MADTRFTSDFHLGHFNIIRYCNRPFADTREMNAAIVKRMNASVKPDDALYFLGDFCMGGPKAVTRLNVFREALDHPIRPIDTDLIFFGEPGRNGKRGPYAFDRMWQEIKREQGIMDFRFHDLRHEAVSRFVEAVSLTKRSQRLVDTSRCRC